MNRASAHSFTWQAGPAYGNINSQCFHFSTGHGNQHQMSEKFTYNDITSVVLILTSRNIHLTMFFLSSDFYPMATECIWGKQWCVYQKSLQVKHEDCEQVRAVRSWHHHPPTPPAHYQLLSGKGLTEEMWDAGTDVFLIFFFFVIFYVCLVYVQFMHTLGMCTLLQDGQFKAWLLSHCHAEQKVTFCAQSRRNNIQQSWSLLFL